MSEVIIDVREKDEYEAEHIENSINIPLSRFAKVAPGTFNQLRDRDVLIMCRSGARAQMAADQIRHLGFNDKINAKIFDGGILEWVKQGKPTLIKKKFHLPIMRQVQLIAGSIVVSFTILGAVVNVWFLAASVFVGAGLMFAGLTGFCGLARLLSFMPWNKLDNCES